MLFNIFIGLVLVGFGHGQSCANNMQRLGNGVSCQDDRTCQNTAVGYFCYQTTCCMLLNSQSGSYGSSCNNNNQCTIGNSECRSSVCYCRSGYNFNGNTCNYGTTSSNPQFDNNPCGFGQIQINNYCYALANYGERCMQTQQCNFYGAVCSSSTCRCNQGNIYNGQSCVTDSDYPFDQGSAGCRANQVQINGQCYMKVNSGGACLYNEQCTTSNNRAMRCTNSICTSTSQDPGNCNSNQISINGMCYMKASVGQACIYDLQCSSNNMQLSCRNNVCTQQGGNNGGNNGNCNSNQVSINGQCYMRVSLNNACIYNQQCNYNDRNINCNNGVCTRGNNNGGNNGGNGVCQANGAMAEMIGNNQYKNCLNTQCSNGYRCEYSSRVNGGQYICCGSSTNGGIYGQTTDDSSGTSPHANTNNNTKKLCTSINQASLHTPSTIETSTMPTVEKIEDNKELFVMSQTTVDQKQKAIDDYFDAPKRLSAHKSSQEPTFGETMVYKTTDDVTISGSGKIFAHFYKISKDIIQIRPKRSNLNAFVKVDQAVPVRMLNGRTDEEGQSGALRYLRGMYLQRFDRHSMQAAFQENGNYISTKVDKMLADYIKKGFVSAKHLDGFYSQLVGIWDKCMIDYQEHCTNDQVGVINDPVLRLFDKYSILILGYILKESEERSQLYQIKETDASTIYDSNNEENGEFQCTWCKSHYNDYSDKEKIFHEIVKAGKKLMIVKKLYPSKKIAENVECILMAHFRGQLKNSDSVKPSFPYTIHMYPKTNSAVAELILRDFAKCKPEDYILKH
uniref:Prion-like-(Q/N-rich) domain-bearing protein 25 n=1 Tax=Rhabditophanes sp. KR3021 TaxID=114890 RepID=A0AC35TWX5_9BILA